MRKIRTAAFVGLIATCFNNLPGKAANQDTLTLDWSHCTQWVRVKSENAAAYHDEFLSGGSLLRISLHALNSDATVTGAVLWFSLSGHPNQSFTIGTTDNHSWHEGLMPMAIWSWPVSGAVKTVSADSKGRVAVDVTEYVQAALADNCSQLDLKLEGARYGVASPAYVKYSHRPLLMLSGSNLSDEADLVVESLGLLDRSSVAMEGELIQIEALMANNGCQPSDSVRCSFLKKSLAEQQFTEFDSKIIPGIGHESVSVLSDFHYFLPGDSLKVNLILVNEADEISTVNNQMTRVLCALETGSTTTDFEANADNWLPRSDVPFDVNTGEARYWSVERIDSVAAEGAFSLSMALDGGSDDGTVWVQRLFQLNPYTRYQVDLSFSLWSPSQSDFNNWKVVAKADTAQPFDELHFEYAGPADLAAGWHRYSKSWQIESDRNGHVWIALGVSAVWESMRAYAVDEITVRFSPAASAVGDVTQPASHQRNLNIYPNPGHGLLNITAPVTAAGEATLEICNVRGQRVRSIEISGAVPPFWQGRWDGCNDNGVRQPSGVYIIQFHQAGRFSRNRAVLLN